MRHLIIEEPVSVAAIWSRRLSVFAIVVAGMGVALARLNPTDVIAGL